MAEQQQQKPQEVSPEDALERFRETLADLIPVLERLEDNCDSVGELIGVLRLALTNDAQLRMLLGKVMRKR